MNQSAAPFPLPVEEVFCRYTCGPGVEPLSLAVHPPYPGWQIIREGIRENDCRMRGDLPDRRVHVPAIAGISQPEQESSQVHVNSNSRVRQVEQDKDFKII